MKNNKYDITFKVSDFPDLKFNIISYNYRSSVFNPVDQLNIEIFSDDIEDLVSKTYGLRKVFFYIDGKKQFAGIIINQSINDNGIVSLECESYLSILNMATFDNSIKIKQGEDIFKTIQKSITHLNFNEVSDNWQDVKKERTGYDFSSTTQEISRTIGYDWKKQENENVFSLIKRIIERYGLFLQYGTNGIAIFKLAQLPQNRENTHPGTIIRNYKDKISNILNGSVQRNYKDFKTYYETNGRTVGAKEATQTLNTIIPTESYATDIFINNIGHIQSNFNWDKVKITELPAEGRIYIPFYSKDTDSKNKQELENKTYREYAKTLKELLVAEYTFSGHELNDVLLCPDIFIKINDNIGGINESMYISDVSFSYSDKPITRILCYSGLINDLVSGANNI
jgi:hypothetical protein